MPAGRSRALPARRLQSVYLLSPAYHEPLRRDALARGLAPDGRVILLGSIASPKYRDVLLDRFGERLLFPSDFVGRGDMSRGGRPPRLGAKPPR